MKFLQVFACSFFLLNKKIRLNARMRRRMKQGTSRLYLLAEHVRRNEDQSPWLLDRVTVLGHDRIAIRIEGDAVAAEAGNHEFAVVVDALTFRGAEVGDGPEAVTTFLTCDAVAEGANVFLACTFEGVVVCECVLVDCPRVALHVGLHCVDIVTPQQERVHHRTFFHVIGEGDFFVQESPPSTFRFRR